MRNDYEMLTVKSSKEYSNVKYLTVDEKEIEEKVERYLLNTKRYETNEKIVEALLA